MSGARGLDPLYRIEVQGGTSFLYDLVDVGRFAMRMAAEGDSRTFSVQREDPSAEGQGEVDGNQGLEDWVERPSGVAAGSAREEYEGDQHNEGDPFVRAARGAREDALQLTPEEAKALLSPRYRKSAWPDYARWYLARVNAKNKLRSLASGGREADG